MGRLGQIAWNKGLTKIVDDRLKWGPKYLDFESARSFAHNLKLTGLKDWVKWCRANDTQSLGIPTNPMVYYFKNGWVSVSDWLGIDSYKNKRNIDYISYDKCKDYILKNFPEIIGKDKWGDLDKNKLPLFIPKRPDYVYKRKGWINWESFLNSPLSPRSKSKLFLSFQDAKKYVSSLKFKNEYEYYSFIKENNINFLPQRPDNAYHKLWKGYMDFLGFEHGRKSFGEKKIKEILDEYSISYEREKKFKGCKKSSQFYISSN